MNHNLHDGMNRWFAAELRVRYSECDQMGVVYHGNYLNWFEVGRTEMIRESGHTYRSMEDAGVLLPVTDLNVNFRQPANYDDKIVVFTRMTVFTKLRLSYTYEIRRWDADASANRDPMKVWRMGEVLPGELLVTGETSHVWLSKDWKPVRLDRVLPELYDTLSSLFTGDGKR
ncbi:thioesterase family protein [Paenibacillus sp. JX-17]|uniref:Thioesterase family protein n=1 Tax=Paenibacillus lacisoli TaxID=3064525 RepID=A0ABT9CA31_9BACL|nr:thioesterase family protein [Paenibacillus sp. JX-17]MDO7906109.1 thioesterase family protein [Paenibacillus sp. JX-17]